MKVLKARYAHIIILTVICPLLTQTKLKAQFTLSGEFRPRSEYRHGYRALPTANQEAAFFIDQRTRINLDFVSEDFDVKFVLQDVRVWGSQSQLVVADGATTTIHEAWSNVKLTDWVSLKLGRQEIFYDDHRIFGNSGWAQQARSHDAAIFKVNNNGFKLDLGLAYNQDAAALGGRDYTVGTSTSYKTFQYLWAHKDFDNFNASLLFLNLGNQGFIPDPVTAIPDGKTFFQQTLGGRFGYKRGALNTHASIYTQFGDMTDNVTSVNGLLLSIDAKYTLSKKHMLFAGFQHISGNDQVNPTANKNEAFTPYFAGNHGFNGLMDYFYVAGNHVGSVGLNDIQFGYTGQLTDKLSTGLATHFFSSDGEVIESATGNAMTKSLGTEFDITGGYKLSNEVAFTFCYAQMLGSESLVKLRGGDKNETANWAWLMITIKPTFFTTEEKQKD